MTIDKTIQEIYDNITKIENIVQKREDTKAISKTPSNE